MLGGEIAHRDRHAGGGPDRAAGDTADRVAPRVDEIRTLAYRQRLEAGKFTINGVNMESIAKVVENGRKLAEYRAEISVKAINRALAASRSK